MLVVKGLEDLFKKVCPYCHEDSYSASGVGNWVCPYCSQNITDVQPETAGYNKHYPVNIAKEDMKHGKENKK
ncbi:MAG TPA: hypothetical protein DEF34_06935 [Desulfotomaculum sp.]|nr:MAG: hypothetical protein JL56_12690 [Desulfotomaculum sp. BICA1-6]HBX23345.1 hypothetical protein [Desulfotomaculum sp.]